MTVRRIVSAFCAAVILCLCMVTPARAASDNESAWIELLEMITTNANGTNVFSITTSAVVSIQLPQRMKLRKVDMLVVTPNGVYPSKVSVTADTQTFDLTVYKVAQDLIRVSGYIPNTMYSTLNIKFQKTSSTKAEYQFLSLKVSSVGMQEFQANYEVYVDGVNYGTEHDIELPSYADTPSSTEYMGIVRVLDWAKYDVLTIWGAVYDGSIDSIRANFGTSGLPYTVNYFSGDSLGAWSDTITEYKPGTDSYLGDTQYTPEYNTVLFCITIDLAGVDRAAEDLPTIYISGSYDWSQGAFFNVQYVNGGILVADTSTPSLWNRFTSFMKGLFNPDDSDSENEISEAEQIAGEIDDLNSQLQEMDRPSVDEIPVDLGVYVSPADTQLMAAQLTTFTNDSLFGTILSMSLVISMIGYVLYGKR